MTSFTVDQWQHGQCWKNRFCEDVYSGVRTAPCCPEAGVYGQADGPERMFRWCLAHRQRSDVFR